MDLHNIGPAQPGRIAVATSIPPKLKRSDATIAIDEKYQQLCIQSWADCGFRILSVNDRSEIPVLSTRYPQVNFVAADRSAALGEGRKPPFIADILAALAGQPEQNVGIINSDLLFEPGAAWRTYLPKLPGRTVATGQRYDTSSLLHNAAYRYFWGFDYFFFERDVASRLAGEAASFAMGLPWWDYWFPMVLALRGFRILSLERPATIHLAHTQSVSTMAHSPAWRAYGLKLAKHIADEPRDPDRPLPAPLGQAQTLCAELLALAENPSTGYMAIDQRLIKLAHVCVRCIGAEPVSAEITPAAAPDASAFTPSGIFAGFPNRLFAGKTYYSAVECEKLGKTEEAWALYRQALEAAPNDTELLLTWARYHTQRGEYAEAESLIRKAIGLVPNSELIWNSLGATLGATNRNGEAIACFERALTIEPASRAGNYYLALLLYNDGRLAEALSRLEAASAAIADFSEGRELEATIRRALSVRD